jgi:hypothetical protein
LNGTRDKTGTIWTMSDFVASRWGGAPQNRRIGTLLMFAVRSIFAKPERVAVAMHEAAAKGQVQKWLGQTAEPLAFLVHEGGASNITDGGR